MFNITFEKPYIYVDPEGDEYTFYIFADRKGNKHFSIKVVYVDSKKSIPLFGYEVLGHMFGLPLDGETILWHAYDDLNSPRGRCMSEEARKMANKIFKLKAFL